MSDESDMLREIERDERWLRQAMPAEPPASLEPLKLRVRVAVHEAWLANAADVDAGAADLKSVRQAVRGEIARLRPDRAGHETPDRPRVMRLRWSLWAGSLTAAAAILISLLVLRSYGPAEGEMPTADVALKLTDWIEILQNAVPDPDEADSAWDELEADLASLEDSLADSGRSAWSEDEFDELDGELEVLLEQIGQDS